MKVIEGVGALAPFDGGCVVTVGTFDGVHVGHRVLIARAIETAARIGVPAAAVTWDRHPMATLRPDRVPPLLTSTERKLELLEDEGLDVVAVLAFDDELSHWPPERFARDVLADGLNAKAVVVGADWRFGHKAAGDVTLLTQLGTGLGFEVEGVTLQGRGAEAVSSSRVRRAVATGAMEEAGALLGRPFDLDGVVIRGDDRGAALGYPTANAAIDPRLAHPPIGVYAGRARIGPAPRPLSAGRRNETTWRAAAVNLGVNPTFGGDPATTPPRIEAFLLDFEGDLYGRTIRVEFWARLRDEMRFDSADALIAQMGRDVAATRELVGPLP